MKIETKFDVGYKFWVPRVEWVYEEDIIYTKGKTYTSTDRILKASAKPKTLVRIVVTLEENYINIEYYCQTGHAYNSAEYGVVYSPEYMQFSSEEDALDWAEKWKEEKGTAYCEH